MLLQFFSWKTREIAAASDRERAINDALHSIRIQVPGLQDLENTAFDGAFRGSVEYILDTAIGTNKSAMIDLMIKQLCRQIERSGALPELSKLTQTAVRVSQALNYTSLKAHHALAA